VFCAKKAEKETNLSFGTVQLILKKDLHFFHCRVSVVHEIKPLDNKSPHNTTFLNSDRWSAGVLNLIVSLQLAEEILLQPTGHT
jgi:hypothetical protein